MSKPPLSKVIPLPIMAIFFFALAGAYFMWINLGCSQLPFPTAKNAPFPFFRFRLFQNLCFLPSIFFAVSANFVGVAYCAGSFAKSRANFIASAIFAPFSTPFVNFSAFFASSSTKINSSSLTSFSSFLDLYLSNE